MRMNLSRVLLLQGLNSQGFTISRSTGSFVSGRWAETIEEIEVPGGIISVARERDLAQIPGGDQIKGAMNFLAPIEMFVTRNDGDDSGVSDRITWDGKVYKLLQVAPWKDYGFYAAIGDRVKGS